MAEIFKINDRTWRIEDGGVRFFLLAGTERALLVDSGMTVENVRALAGTLTDLPLLLLNTHADPDHIGGNGEFDSFLMHPAEAGNYYKTRGREGTFVPVWDGQVIDLGSRPLRIVHTPGHTPGSIAVLDERYRKIFTGDPIQDGRIYMFGIQREMHAYRESLRRIWRLRDRYDEIWPSHGTCPVTADLIPRLDEAAGEILSGALPYDTLEMRGQLIRSYRTEAAVFLCDA